ncbi:MAG: response regulator [Chloroflexota bacterium]|jgi:two-component system response regulator
MRDKIILLVEDNPDDIDLTLRAFKKSNLLNEVVVARDGVEALELLHGKVGQEGKGLPVMPQVVLLDLKLPKIDGLGVLKKLRANERTRLLPVVVMTSSGEEQDMVASYSLGANSYIRKPVDFDQFLSAVQQLGLYWLLLNEAPPKR